MNAGVAQPGRDDLAADRVGQRDVGSDVEPEPHVRPRGGTGPPRIDGIQPRAAPLPLQHVVEEDGMRLARVRSPQDDEVRFLDLLVGARAATRSEHRRQTDDAGGVSSPVAAVDVVAAEDAARELLRQIVHFVGRLRATEHPEAARARARRRCARSPSAARSSASSQVASRSAPVLADHRLRQSRVFHPSWREINMRSRAGNTGRVEASCDGSCALSGRARRMQLRSLADTRAQEDPLARTTTKQALVCTWTRR